LPTSATPAVERLLQQFEGIADRVSSRYRNNDHYDDLRQAALIGIWMALERGIVNENWLGRIARNALIDELRLLLGKHGQKRFFSLTERVKQKMVDLQGAARRSLDDLRDVEKDRFKLDNVIRAHCCKVLNLCNGNREQAAKVLGIGRATAFRWFSDWQRMQD
jgi:DNA-directed RNA polymerase specialized sigma24 family protein